MRKSVLTAVRPALDWLKDSGIQESRGADAGGVYAWLDEAGGGPSFLYSEITGYFMTLCTHLHLHDPEGGWLHRAKAAGAWIVGRAQREDGAVLCRKWLDPERAAVDPYSFEHKKTLFFDCAMVGTGLLRLYEETQAARWLEAAQHLGEFSLRAFESSDRRVRHAVFDLARGQPEPPGDRWSAHFGPFQLKGAMFFVSLARATGDEAYRAFAERILAGALAVQRDDGRFPTSLAADATHLHPHSYAIEGLLWLAAHEGRRELLGPAARAIDGMFRTCLVPRRPIQQWSDSPEHVFPGVRTDALAQALRAYHLAKRLDDTLAWPWEEVIPSLHDRLDSHRLASGGLRYGEDEYGKKPTHANAWCQFFAIEASLWHLADEALDPRTLILT